MDCKHERKKCVNNIMFCAACGARIGDVVGATQPDATEPPTMSASGRRIGFDAEAAPTTPKKRRTAKKKGE